MTFTAFSCSFVFLYFRAIVSDAFTLQLLPDETNITYLPVNESITIVTGNLSTDVFSVLCQVHTQTGNISLSSEPIISYENGVNGQDIGIISLRKGKISNITWYLYSNSSITVKVLINLQYFTDQDPLIGGCNEEFNLENDPNIHLNVYPTKSTVQYQWSNSGINPSTGVLPSCEDSTYQSYLDYTIYVYYLQADEFSVDNYFDSLRNMMTPYVAEKYGTKVHSTSNSGGQKSTIDIASYKSRGVVYTIVVTYSNKKTGHVTKAAYIPVVSYGCDIEHQDVCKQRNAVNMVFCTIGGLIGLFICFVGHRYFKTVNFLFGFMIFSLIFYQIFTLETGINYTGTLVLAAIFGLIGGALLLGLWWYCGIPVLNVLIMGLLSGYIITSVAFYTPLGNLSYFTSSFNYGAIFACGVLVVPVLLLCFTRFLSIFTCALTGSLSIVIMLDIYLNSGLHYFILNSLRHGTDVSFIHVFITGPYKQHEIALTVVWILVFIFGLLVQLVRERKKAPFPPCPRQLQDRDKDLRSLLRAHRGSPARSTQSRGDNSREPLLRGGNSRQYGATDSQTQTEEESEEEINRPRMV
ncbi:Transmembrane 7 superfamily member 3 [Mactra antiquata]